MIEILLQRKDRTTLGSLQVKPQSFILPRIGETIWLDVSNELVGGRITDVLHRFGSNDFVYNNGIPVKTDQAILITVEN